MSSTSGAARARTSRVAEAAAQRARLTVVPRTLTRPPQLPFAVLTALALIGGVVGLLMFNTNMAAASFRVTALQQQLSSLQAREDRLNLALDRLRDPQRLARRAKAMGMVPLGAPSFIRLPDGQVLGDPQIAHRASKPQATTSSTASPSPSPSPSPSASPTGSTTQPQPSPTSDGSGSTPGTKKAKTSP
jgi:hypothetical protein